MSWGNTLIQFYICSYVRRNSSLKESNKMQQYADIYLLINYSTCFDLYQRLQPQFYVLLMMDAMDARNM